MEALILSCGTGGGHNAAGYAVKEELERRGHNVKMLDPYTLKGNHIDRLIDNAYIKLVQRVPLAFGAVYGLGNLYRRLPFRSPVYFLNRKMVPVMERRPLPRSSRPAPMGRPSSEKAVWLRP